MSKNKKMNYNVTLWILVGLILGILVGLVMPQWLETPISVVASIYMSALRMMIYPLVFCSLIMGIVGIGNIAKTGKIGLHALLWYIGTTALASGLGLILPKILHLGEGAQIVSTGAEIEAASFSGLLDTITTLIPSNPLVSFVEGNMLQVLAFAVIMGLACLSLKEKAQPVVDLVQSVNDISIWVVGKVMLCTPVGVFCCIASVMHANSTDTMLQVAQVMIALYVTFAVYAAVVYGGIVKFVGKMSPLKFFKGIAPAALNAFGTCSSSATIPLSMKCATENLEIPEEISSLTLPLGATINMDAVSILMSFMITFFASACGVPLTTGTMLTVLACNVLLSIGTPGVPGGAIAAFAALAPIAGLPVSTIMGVYIVVNTLADMGATCVNVMGDLACTTVLKHTLRKITGK
ncbi:MAG: dicarboxylate/amino acid:cation symporter [Lachnospiraceae bacterium]|nr:dicarboxylate/amino acid:cation symporter [Lachnospiraceae bacterium]